MGAELVGQVIGVAGRIDRITHPFDKRILFVTGKGGVGKTTVSLALGLAAAAAGKRTIVCEVSSQEAAARMFDRPAIGFNETELRPNLFSISIDPDDSIREYLELQLPVRAMGDLLHRSKVFSYLAAATPGLKEMVTVGKIWELALNRRKTHHARPYDLVIVDAPATGHGLGLVESPKTFEEIARVGPMARQAGTIRRTITDSSKAGAILVALPEEMPVNETATLESALRDRIGIAVDRVYMNACFPGRFDEADSKRIATAGERATGEPAAALAAAVDETRRARAHEAQLARLVELTRCEVRTLPFVFDPELGLPALEQLAQGV